jgi:hypothetical protein
MTSFLFFLAFFFNHGPGRLDIIIDKLSAMLGVFAFIYGIVFYLILSFIYLALYYLVDRSVSATILEIIDNSPERKLTCDEIKKIYSVENKYQTELKGMLEGGFIIKELDYYKNSLKGSIYARIVRRMKAFFKLGAGG